MQQLIKSLLSVILITFLAFSSIGCGQSDIDRAADNLLQISSIAVTAQAAIIKLNERGILNDGNTRIILIGFRKVGQVGKQAIAVVAAMQKKSELTNSDRAILAAALNATAASILNLSQSTFITSNPEAQETLAFWIGTLSQISRLLVTLFVSNFNEHPVTYLAVRPQYNSEKLFPTVDILMSMTEVSYAK